MSGPLGQLRSIGNNSEVRCSLNKELLENSFFGSMVHTKGSKEEIRLKNVPFFGKFSSPKYPFESS